MADKNFTLDIVTPEKRVFSGSVQSFTAPGAIGSFQVLVNHAPLLSSLQVGGIKFTDAAGKTFQYATSGGFVEVNQNNVIVLAETAERSDEIDPVRAENARKRAVEQLAERSSMVDEARARAALARALNRLKIAAK